MTTTAFDDQFTDAPAHVTHRPYDTGSILRRNVADLELALKQQTERAEAAEAELAMLRKQEPIKYLYRVTDCFGHDVLRDDPKGATILETIPLYAAPIPAPAAPRKYHEFASVMLDAQPFITAETYGGRYIVAMRFERLGKMQDCHAALLALLQSAEVTK